MHGGLWSTTFGLAKDLLLQLLAHDQVGLQRRQPSFESATRCTSYGCIRIHYIYEIFLTKFIDTFAPSKNNVASPLDQIT